MNNKLTVARTTKGDLFVSAEILKLVDKPKYDFDSLLIRYGFLVNPREDITIYQLIDRVRAYSEDYKVRLLCDIVECQTGELLGPRPKERP